MFLKFSISFFHNLFLDNFKTLFQSNIDTDKDSIIPESIRYQIMRDHGLTMRNAILFVMTSTFVIVVVFAFLILGMTMFAEGDAFSSAISSLLGATAGIVNIVNSSKKDDSKLNRLANKLIDTWASYSKNDTGISLNDDLRDTVIRRSKYIKQLEVADRAEVNDSTMFNQMEDQLKSYTSGIVSNKVEMVNQVVKDQAQHQIDEVKENVNDSVGGLVGKIKVVETQLQVQTLLP